MNKKKVTLPNHEEYFYLETEKKDKTIVLIHGNLSSSIHYLPLIEVLKEEYHILAPDMRGFGDSSYHTPIDSLEDLSDDIAMFMNEKGVKNAHIFGWSTGGAIALKIAAKYPKLVDKIVLIESASYRGYPVYQKDANGAPLVGQVYHTKEELALDPVNVLPIKNALEQQDYNFMKFIWDNLIYNVGTPYKEYDLFLKESLKQRNIVDIDWALTTFNMSNFTNGLTMGDDSIKKVTQPVLSLWGDKDIVVLEYMIDETIEALQNAKKVVIKDSGHSPIDTKTNEIVKEIRQFLS